MTATTHDLIDLRTRLDRLERQARRWQTLAVGLALTAGLSLLLAADKREQSTKTDRLSLVGSDGSERASMSVTKEGPTLSFFDEKGKEAGRIVLNREGFVMFYRDHDGKFATGLSLEKNGVAFAATSSTDKPQFGPPAVKQILGPALKEALQTNR